MPNPHNPRRSFVQASLLALAGLANTGDPLATIRTAAPPDEPWLRGLTGEHRAFFDVDAVREGILGKVDNLLQVYRDEYGLRDSDVNVVFGAHGSGLSFVLDDAIWEKYQLGRFYSIVDPRTGNAAMRNIFLVMDAADDWPADYSVTALQEQGVRFLACRGTMRNLSRQVALAALAAADEIIPSPDKVLGDLQAGVIPGAITVPAMIVAQNRAQEAGLKYVYVA